MKNQSQIFIVGVFVCTISGCGNSNTTEKTIEKIKPTPNQKIGKVLPFKVCNIYNNHAFNDGFSMLDVDVKVDGGHSNDWVVTGIAIAKYLGNLAISTDVTLTIYRNDLGELDTKQTPNGYKWLTRINYGVDPSHSMNTSNGQKQWLISYATDESVATLKDIQIDRDFQALVEKYNNPPIDDKIVAIIKKKYEIRGEFKLPPMNLSENTSNPNDYFIDEKEQDGALKALSKFQQPQENRKLKNLECSV